MLFTYSNPQTDHAIGPPLSKEAGMGKRVMADGQMGTRLTPTPTASPHYQDPDGGEHKWRRAYKTKYRGIAS